jgi:hypothetical protein
MVNLCVWQENQICTFLTYFQQYQISWKFFLWGPRWYVRTDVYDEVNSRLSHLCERASRNKQFSARNHELITEVSVTRGYSFEASVLTFWEFRVSCGYCISELSFCIIMNLCWRLQKDICKMNLDPFPNSPRITYFLFLKIFMSPFVLCKVFMQIVTQLITSRCEQLNRTFSSNE